MEVLTGFQVPEITFQTHHEHTQTKVVEPARIGLATPALQAGVLPLIP